MVAPENTSDNQYRLVWKCIGGVLALSYHFFAAKRTLSAWAIRHIYTPA